MNKILLAFFVILLIGFVNAESFVVILSNNGGVVAIEDVTVRSAGANLPLEVGDYDLILLGENGSQIFSTKISFERPVIIENGDFENLNSETEVGETHNIILNTLVEMLPYSENAVSIAVLKDGQELDKFNVEHLIDKCNDNICQESENHISCPNDCASGGNDGYCDMVQDNICDADCDGTEPECKTSEIPQPGFDLLPVAIVIVIILVAVFIYTRKK
ncbi:MAG TPA: hypothetical protein VFF13_01660 [archaeon]|nr:hypothetical protein [archaeon]